jgi:hypothetical protein
MNISKKIDLEMHAIKNQIRILQKNYLISGYDIVDTDFYIRQNVFQTEGVSGPYFSPVDGIYFLSTVLLDATLVHENNIFQGNQCHKFVNNFENIKFTTCRITLPCEEIILLAFFRAKTIINNTPNEEHFAKCA